MKQLHPWDVDVEQAKQVQESLRHRVILKNRVRRARTVGGADVAYSKDGTTMMAAVVTLSFPSLERLETATVRAKVTFPYMTGFLSFREGPALIEAFGKLKAKPDIMIFEGQGIAHPRRFGLASHLGVWLDLPSVGCTKTPLVEIPITVGMGSGDVQTIRKDGEEIGAAVRTRQNVKPVFVSPGHRIDLAESIQLIIATCRGYRLPEPLRIAHQTARETLEQVIHKEMRR